MTHPRSRTNAFTLVEVIATIGILIVLSALVITVVAKLPGSADRAKSTANLRNLYLALDTYTQEQLKWPQQPDFGITQQLQYEDWWIRTMAPYGMTELTWQCPGILRLGKIQENRNSPRVHYSPTMFDADPRTPYRWSTQPWAIQIANVFGRGALIVFPDGSVRDMDDVLAEAQKDKPSQ